MRDDFIISKSRIFDKYVTMPRDVLPAPLRRDPLVGRFLAIGRTDLALAAKADLLAMFERGVGTAVGCVAHHFQPARQHTVDVVNEHRTNLVTVLLHISPPGGATLEQLFYWADGSNDEYLTWTRTHPTLPSSRADRTHMTAFLRA